MLDLHDHRVSEMDAHGIAYAILPELSSHSGDRQSISRDSRSPPCQRCTRGRCCAQAESIWRIRGTPAAGPDAAAEELTRAVRDLGFKGALANGFSQVGSGEDVVYYDHPAYAAFWQRVEELDVPFYLTHREPLPSREPIYEGHPWLLGPVWAFAAETAVHALRLMCSGLFESASSFDVDLGHLGEDCRTTRGASTIAYARCRRAYPRAGRSPSTSAPTSFSRRAATSERQPGRCDR
jgi:2,3-dihydroxybenzoate decarboxylase